MAKLAGKVYPIIRPVTSHRDELADEFPLGDRLHDRRLLIRSHQSVPHVVRQRSLNPMYDGLGKRIVDHEKRC